MNIRQFVLLLRLFQASNVSDQANFINTFLSPPRVVYDFRTQRPKLNTEMNKGNQPKPSYSTPHQSATINYREMEVNRRAKEINDAYKNLEKREKVLIQHQEELKTQQSQFNKKLQEFYDKEKKLEAKEATNKATRADIQKEQLELSEERNDLEKKTAQLDKQRKKYESEYAEFKEEENVFHDEESEFDKKMAQNSSILANIRRVQSELNETEKKLGTKQSELSQTEEQLGTKQSELSQTVDLLGTKQSELSQTEEQLENKQTELNEIEERLGIKQSELYKKESIFYQHTGDFQSISAIEPLGDNEKLLLFNIYPLENRNTEELTAIKTHFSNMDNFITTNVFTSRDDNALNWFNENLFYNKLLLQLDNTRKVDREFIMSEKITHLSDSNLLNKIRNISGRKFILTFSTVQEAKKILIDNDLVDTFEGIIKMKFKETLVDESIYKASFNQICTTFAITKDDDRVKYLGTDPFISAIFLENQINWGQMSLPRPTNIEPSDYLIQFLNELSS